METLSSPATLVCAHCGISFVPGPHKQGGRKPGTRVFCSTKCASAFYNARHCAAMRARPDPEPRICAVCGKLFQPDRMHPFATACSKECNIRRAHDRARAATVKRREARLHTAICPECGTEFTTSDWRQKYCSRRCMTNATQRHRRKVLPSTIKTASRHKARWNGVWLMAMERAQHQCELCGATDNLQGHHLDGEGEKQAARQGARHLTTLDNIIVLCDRCHHLFHHLSLLRKGKGWVVESEIFGRLGLTVTVRKKREQPIQ